MKKTILSLVLSFSMSLSLFVPAYAVGKDELVTDTSNSSSNISASYTDENGDSYVLTYQDNDGYLVSTVANRNGDIISRAEMVRGKDEITVTNYQSGATSSTQSSVANQQSVEVKTYRLQDFVIDEPEICSNAAERDMSNPVSTNATIPGSSAYTYHGTYNSNISFLGQILTGDCYYRRVGTYSTYNRHSFAFERGVELAVVTTVIGAIFSFVTATTLRNILIGVGISFTGSALGMDAELDCEVHAYDFQFKCQMKFENKTYNMCEITRKLEYLYTYEKNLDKDVYEFDMSSYLSANDAITAYCKEAVGYSEQAYEAKFMNQTKPNLSLPVSGPVWP